MRATVIDSASSPKPDIVLYEDDTGLALEIREAFASEGHTITLASTEAGLLEAAAGSSRRILIMDRIIHGLDSLTIIERLRKSGNRTPVLVISSLDSIDERIQGLKKGGDDYLVKPFAMGELIARAEALMRRSTPLRDTRLVVGDLVLDVVERTVHRGQRLLILAPREFGLLEYLMRHPGQVVTRAMILEDVWKYRAPLETNVVNVHMSNLRRKVDAPGDTPLIANKRGLGFMIGASNI